MALPILGGRGGKRAADLKARGAPKSKRLTDIQIKELLKDHGFKSEYADKGGVTAFEPTKRTGGGTKTKRKHFKEGTTINTVRKWLGY
jgi:hypothetical protein